MEKKDKLKSNYSLGSDFLHLKIAGQGTHLRDVSSLLNGIQIFSEDSYMAFCFLCGIIIFFRKLN